MLWVLVTALLALGFSRGERVPPKFADGPALLVCACFCSLLPKHIYLPDRDAGFSLLLRSISVGISVLAALALSLFRPIIWPRWF